MKKMPDSLFQSLGKSCTCEDCTRGCESCGGCSSEHLHPTHPSISADRKLIKNPLHRSNKDRRGVPFENSRTWKKGRESAKKNRGPKF